jgi:hypothetical protein
MLLPEPAAKVVPVMFWIRLFVASTLPFTSLALPLAVLPATMVLCNVAVLPGLE